MDEHRTGVVLQLPDPTLGDSILPMSVHAAEAESLLSFSDCLAKQVVSKDTIVSMVMLDPMNSVFSGELLKAKLGFHSFFCTCRSLSVNIGQTAVLVDKHSCIGCRSCVMACPYKARSFVHEALDGQKPDVPRGKGTVEGCTLCVHKVDRGESPACVSACSAAGHNAMQFGNLNDPDSEIARRIASFPSRQVREDLNLDTGVRYAGI